MEKVVVIDDDRSIRISLIRLLEAEGYSVDSYASAIAYLESPVPSEALCVLLDVRMPGIGGPELQRKLAERDTGEQIIFITGHGDVPLCVECMKSGAVDFLLKPFKSEDLFRAIGQGLKSADQWKRKKSIHQKTLSVRKEAELMLKVLTPREFEIFRWLIAGLLNKQIAAELGLSEKTVKIHRGRVTSKLGISAVADMVRLAQDAGVEPARKRPT